MQYKQLTEDPDIREDPRHIQSKDINFAGGSVSVTNGADIMGTPDEAQLRKKKYIKWGIIGGIALIVVILAIVLPLVLIKKGGGGDDNGHHPLAPGNMNPYSSVGGSESFSGSGSSVSGRLHAGKLNLAQASKAAIPKQFLKNLLNTVDEKDTTKKIGVDWRNLNFFGANNMLIPELQYTIDLVSTSIAKLVLAQGNGTRFSIPDTLVTNTSGNPTNRMEMMGLTLNDAAKKENFGIRLTDVNDPTSVFLSSVDQTLLFADKYIQMDFVLQSQRIYGLGDRLTSFLLGEGAYTMWASGQTPSFDDGRGRGGLSGVHPFVLVQSAKNSQRYIGMYFRNSNAMTPVIRFNDDGTSTLSFITIGGQVELYIFAQGSAHQVIQNYQQFIGLAKLPPFWAIGWQEASPAMIKDSTDQDSVLAAANNYKTNGFPLDSVYLPSNSWDSVQDFVLDNAKYPDVSKLAAGLKANNQKLVAYVDAAVNTKDRTKNNAYLQGNKTDGFIKTSINKANPDGYLVNSKLGKQVVYYDWFNNQCFTVFSDLIKGYSTSVPFDGVWTTMNEPFGDIAGEIALNTAAEEEKPTTSALIQKLLQAVITDSQTVVGGGEETPYDQSWFFSFWPLDQLSSYFLPFIPELDTVGNYDAQSLSLNATHAGGLSDYDVHSLYPHYMMNVTQSALSAALGDSRPFLLTKGSFASTGKYTASVAHTDNERSWDSLYYGLASVLRSQMFGLPHSGTDICGYRNGGDALDEELCLRWYQMAAFFPLARHSQEENGPRTEPFNIKTPAFQAGIKNAMHDRMQYLRLMYTCLFETSDSGGTCLDPIQFRYTVPDAKYQQAGVPTFTKSFMFAGSLLVSPIMNKTAAGVTTYSAYFPQGSWVNMADWSEVIQGADSEVQLTIRDHMNVHLAPGAVIPFQDNTAQKLMTTQDVLAQPITIVANRDVNGQAGGSLFLDQGISQSEMKNQQYEYYGIQVQANSIQIQPTKFNKGTQPHLLDSFVIVNAADLEEVNFACYFTPDSLEPIMLNPVYNKDKLALTIKSDTPLKFFDILNVYYGSGNKKDLNICNQHSFEYNIDGGIPNYAVKQLEMNLTNKAGTLDNITLNIGFFDQGIINIKWTWQNQSNHKRVPLGVPQSIINTTPRDVSKISDTLDKYIVINDQPFSVQFLVKLDQSPAETVLTLKGLIFDEYLNWVKMEAVAEKSDTEDDFRGIFGLGERASKDLFYKSGVYSLWAKDIDNPVENGKLPGNNIYGVHPFYMFKHAQRSWVGVYHNLAQAQDWWIQNDYTTGKIQLSTISTGGLADIFVFVSAQKPDDIVSKYHSLIGTPVLAPQWALGWSQCRWCYLSTADVEQSTQGYIDNKIPLDVQWVDIDYMSDYKDFTYNGVNSQGQPGAFSGLPEFVNKLHNMNMKFVPIVDAGVSYRPGQDYKAFNDGMQQDVFMKLNGNVFVGKVWPNEAVYPDFFHPATDPWWSSQLDTFQQSLPFDGLWQDMNEASNFCNGVCHHDQMVASPVAYKLPYTPSGESLETKSIALDVLHNNNYTQLDAHSLFGTTQVRSSNLWFNKNNKRTMIISRSSFAGMGKFGSAWLGDNHREVEDMEISVISIMNMNIFGIPLIGADICGFGGNSTRNPELCARWHAVGAFYPFSRNHRICGAEPQDPWMFNTTKFNDHQNFTDLMRDSIQMKYSLIRYFYTQLTQISLGNNTYYTLYKPMFFEFPNDKQAFNDIANNVMIGKAIKTSVNAKDIVSPTTDYYFPAGTWCSLFTPKDACIYNEVGTMETLGSQLNQSYAHIREGYIVPMQDAKALNAMTTVDLQNAPIDLHILGTFRVPGFMAWQAEGIYYNDDGLTTVIQGNANQYKISAQYTQSKVSGESLIITVTQLMTATNHFNVSNNCSAVNAADWLQSVYVYNATAFKQHDNLWVSVSYQDDPDNFETLGSATFDAVTNRIVFDGQTLGNVVCLTRVFRIQFKNFNPVTTATENDQP